MSCRKLHNVILCSSITCHNKPLAVKIVFLIEVAEPEEGGGDVRVVVSGPLAGDTAMCSPALAPGELMMEQGMLSTGGKTETESDICDTGTLTVLTEGASRPAAAPG